MNFYNKESPLATIAFNLLTALYFSLFSATGAFDSVEEYEKELAKYVDAGFVDYKSWAKNHDGLDEFIESLKMVNLDSLNGNETKALFINAYNAGMIWLILRNYPVEEISDIEPEVFEQKAVNIGGVMLSLDGIEHNRLRKMGDHRVHFALVCGSKGCPDLSSELYRSETLDRQLNTAGRDYLSKPKGMVIKRDPPQVSLSMIFKWFGPDFGETVAERLITLSQYLYEEDAEFIRENAEAVEVSYIEYNWSLNGE